MQYNNMKSASPRDQRLKHLLTGLVLTLSSWCQFAVAAFPDHPIQYVAPFAAGGANDYLTRLMAQHMGIELKVSIVTDNKTGANGIVGASFVAKSAPDGYTLLMGNSATHGTNPSLYQNMPYDPSADFAAVSMVGSVPIVLAIDPKLGINTVAELIEYGKKNPGKLAFGSSGIGGTGHLAGEAFKAASGLDVVHAPYKGDAPAVADAAGGQVAMAFIGIASAAPLYTAGKVKVLAVASKNRQQSMPNVPTMSEAGFKDIEFSQWYALFARAGTPKETITKLNQAVKIALARDDVRASMSTQGAEVSYSTPEELNAFYQTEIKRFAEIIKRLNIKAQQ
jgi:tripartite-type tricarboxylate transporter receptor subunit TctC